VVTYGYQIYNSSPPNQLIAEDYGYEKYSYANLAAYTKMNYADPAKYYVKIIKDEKGVFGQTTTSEEAAPGVVDEGVGGDRGGGDAGSTKAGGDSLAERIDKEGIDWQTWAAIATVASVIIMVIVLVMTRKAAG
jgi:hypothetical protein